MGPTSVAGQPPAAYASSGPSQVSLEHFNVSSADIGHVPHQHATRPPCQAERCGERLHTLVIRNLPIRTKPEELIACIHALGYGRYNFFHMPLRNRQRQNKGYAFIGFFNVEVAESFRQAMDGYRIESRQSNKVISCEPARQETSQSIVEPSHHDHVAQWQEIVQAMEQQSPGAYHLEQREIPLGGVVSL